MSIQLPKTRVPSGHGSGAGHGSGSGGRASSIHNISNKGRQISKRINSGSSAQGGRIVSGRGELFRSGGPDLEDAIHFDENKKTILSNFEEWIKLSTDNKITSKNSWQIALIDYFKDLNVIKDGENINFQRASATLDGCVKIYSSRVESVATETGKLLSGLSKKKGEDEAADGDGESGDDEDGDDGEGTNGANGDAASGEVGLDGRKKRKMNRVLESTIVDFETIRVKKLDQELAIDPLFKKALAEFDEGGAKSLLLNTLSVDSSGRVVFDAVREGSNTSDKDGETEAEAEGMMEDVETVQKSRPIYSNNPIDINSLSKFIFNDDTQDFDNLAICPSLGELELVLSDINKAKKVLGDVNNRFLDDETNERRSREQSPFVFPGYDFDDDADLGPGDEDNDLSNHFDETIVRSVLYKDDDENRENGGQQDEENFEYEEKTVLDRDLMAYFDDNMKNNWRGPEHWKVANIRKKMDIIPGQAPNLSQNPGSVVGAKAVEKKKNLEIDFFQQQDDELEEKLFELPKNILSTTLRPEQRVNENHNRLPEDIQYNSSRLTNLFLKKQNTVMQFVRKEKKQGSDVLTDENFFSEKYKEAENEQQNEARNDEKDNPFYDDGDDDYGGIDFNDAISLAQGNDEEGGVIKKENTPETQQLIGGGRKGRPEYVNFSRIAKRVDVRLLKDNLWRAIKKESPEEEKTTGMEEEDDVEDKTKNENETENTNENKPDPNLDTEKADIKQFSDVISSIGGMYASEQKKDLSTSFCFICLLHLANEHGLSISSNDNNDNLQIKGF
ncbi:condensin complex subunit 2 [[Candida] railenensis]|uniref:Condensin complex subunit 2 n=1 Tax=[Candida] railenensis TaxID=45579 RepID=A0A9P0QQY4_9ASCO|nr:condensin complex subunit 2 [[Candida] railenensis]